MTRPTAPPRRRWPVVARLGGALVATGLALGIAEGLARLHVGDLELRADGRRFTTRPGAWGTNAQGFHEREIAPVPAPEVRRVLVLGDSMTWGTATAADTWTRRAEARLGPPWQLVNLSHYGYDAAQSAATLAEWGPRFRPDAVVFATYGNDLVPTRLITVGTPPWPAWVGESGVLPAPLRARSVLARVVEGAWATRTVQEAEDPEAYAAALADLAAQARALHAPLLVVGLVPHVLAAGPGCEALAPGRCGPALDVHARQQALVEAAGLPWWSALPDLRASGRDAFFPEGTRDWEHPDPDGHAVIGEAVAPWIRDALPSEP